MTKKIKPIEKFRKVIDSIAEVSAEIKKLTSKKDDLNLILKNYVATKSLGDDTDAIIMGDGYEVEVGKAGSKREIIDMVKVKKFLGESAFMGVATVAMKDIDQYLTEAQQKKVIKTNRTETRSYKFKLSEPKSNLKKKTKAKQ